ncbi:uncharacterized protein G2W53_024629 [Senna tora]|uniref:Uncharacterized protein n=1 Tax=Senna tora TaxID=362788 RepID=A0A834TD49_9FABA|nr:uncharacterized protein G2W53_024629 [Senna tora]
MGRNKRGGSVINRAMEEGYYGKMQREERGPRDGKESKKPRCSGDEKTRVSSSVQFQLSRLEAMKTEELNLTIVHL